MKLNYNETPFHAYLIGFPASYAQRMENCYYDTEILFSPANHTILVLPLSIKEKKTLKDFYILELLGLMQCVFEKPM